MSSNTTRVNGNWLVGLTRQQGMTTKFPFLKTLANAWATQAKKCDACGQKAHRQAASNQTNETLKILATIPEDKILEFKEATGTISLSISYIDLRGQIQTVTR